MILMSMEKEKRLVINTFSKLCSLPDNTFSSQPRYDRFDTSPQVTVLYQSDGQKSRVIFCVPVPELRSSSL